MSTRNIDFSIGEYYHIYNRGTDKRNIFLDDNDRKRFIKLLFIANGTKPFVFRDFPIGVPYVEIDRGDSLIAIGAYCLMLNHFHVLVREKNENGISKMFGKALTSYATYFNKKYKRTGSLFEGTFKAKHIDTDEYLKYLFAYIHLNPVKIIDPQWKEGGITDRVRAKQYLEKYAYSSYPEYIGVTRQEKKILDKQAFPGYFSKQKNFDDFIHDWLSFSTSP